MDSIMIIMNRLAEESGTWIALAIGYLGLFSLWAYAWFKYNNKK